eukprot:TRINITY_DN25041_c0_g1_i1.p1 TRINITY_DN25041_c0_g1~~TRINITY_DN25041_c0_g1_i1.p1  ORF type:complete len:250 (+),score=57.00 TRINITY_DN25041_c0_g1_i1:47-796(+)
MDEAPLILTNVVRAVVRAIASGDPKVAEDTLVRLRDACLKELATSDPDIIPPAILPPVAALAEMEFKAHPQHQPQHPEQQHQQHQQPTPGLHQPEELVVISQEVPELCGSYFLMEDNMWVSASGKQIRSTPAGKWTISDTIFSLEQHLNRMPNMLTNWCHSTTGGIVICRETYVASPAESSHRSTSPIRQSVADADLDIRQQLQVERVRNSELLSSLKSMQTLLLSHVGSVPSFNEPTSSSSITPVLAR